MQQGELPSMFLKAKFMQEEEFDLLNSMQHLHQREEGEHLLGGKATEHGGIGAQSTTEHWRLGIRTTPL